MIKVAQENPKRVGVRVRTFVDEGKRPALLFQQSLPHEGIDQFRHSSFQLGIDQ